MAKKKKAKRTVAVKQFTTKQQKFIDCYGGDIKEAADKAEISYGYARNLMTKSDIFQAIKNRQDTEVRPKEIANRQRRQEFWTKTMDDESESMRDRLKASELLAKSEADFAESGGVNVNVMTIADIFARTGCKQVNFEAH